MTEILIYHYIFYFLKICLSLYNRQKSTELNYEHHLLQCINVG